MLTFFDRLLDQNSFVEQGALVKNAGVRCGYGTVDGRPVYVYNQSGPVTQAHAKKIASAINSAVGLGMVLIGIMDSPGIKLSESAECFEAYGLIFEAQNKARGVVPQIAVINGVCMGISAFIPSMSDFVFTIESVSKYFLQSPETYEKETNSLPGTEPGMTIKCHSEEECAAEVKKLLEFIPSNNLEQAYLENADDLNREDLSLANGEIDIKRVITSIADNNRYIELKGHIPNTMACLMHIGGYTVGVAAADGLLNSAGVDKITGFVEFCSSFNIPLVTLGNITGILPSASEDGRMVTSGARLIRSLINFDAGKINIILNKAFGCGYFIFNSRHLGADMVYAWENSELSAAPHESAGKVLGNDAGIELKKAGELGLIDDYIHPGATRKRIIAALEILQNKRSRRHI